MNNRIEHIDAVAGLMILWMVFGHLQQVCGVQLQYPNLLFFFMPWFYYKAGMLWKERHVREVANRGGQKFLKPFVLYATIGQTVLTICLIIEGVDSMKPYLYSPIRSLVLGGCVGGNTPLWFIPSLFVVQCLSAFFLSKKDWPWLWAIVSIVCGFCLFMIDSRFIPTYIKSALGGLFFFYMGHWLKDWQYKWWITILCILGYLAVLIFDISVFDVRGNSATGNYFVSAFASLMGCITINGLMKWIQPYLKFYVLQYVGRNAMLIYVTHWIVLLISVRLVASDIFCISNTYWLLLVGGLSCLIIIPVYINILKICQNKKS